ncbi:MAG: radical SAM protein [Deltaproteobacteria bacterium]|nr:radical SAM protein [Deltaproteobacteria bacterium]
MRISSLEPWDVDLRLFARWKDPRLGRHLHLPLQSGSDAVLRRMARRCDSAEYAQLVAAAHEAIPDLTLTTDVIVGFPGESEDDWRATLALCEEMQFAHIHIFSYSPRHGTAAARMGGAVSSEVKRERSRELHRLAGEMKSACLERYVGSSREVLCEGDDIELAKGQRRWSGLTDNYLRCKLTAPAAMDLENRLVQVRLVGAARDHLVGELEDTLASSWPPPDDQR